MLNFSLVVLLLCGITIMLATAIQTAIGLGLGLIAVPVFALLQPDLLPGTLLLLAFPLTASMALVERSAIDWHGFVWMFSGRMAGSVAGAWLIVIMDQNHLQALFGALILAAVALSLPQGFLPIRRGNLIGIGTASGIMGTVAVVGGAPLALLYQDRPGPELRSTLSMIFCLGTLFSLLVLWIAGEVHGNQFAAAVIFLPAIAAGFFVGRKLAALLSGPRIRIGILIFSGLSGSMAIITGIFG